MLWPWRKASLHFFPINKILPLSSRDRHPECWSWTSLNSFMWLLFFSSNFKKYLFIIYFCLQGIWDLSSPPRDRTHIPCIGRRILNHYTTSCCSVAQLCLFATSWTTTYQISLSFTISWSLPKLMSIKSVMPSSHFILCHPLLLLPSIFPRIHVFCNELALCLRWPKYWSFNFSISPSNEYSGLISFKIDWFDLLAVQETLKSLLQHHNSKASIFWCLVSFLVQLTSLDWKNHGFDYGPLSAK